MGSARRARPDLTRAGRALAGLLALGALVTAGRPADAADGLRSVPTRPGVTVSVLLVPAEATVPAVGPTATPTATVVLFPGGHGRLALSPAGIGQLQRNFLVRSRTLFAAGGFLVALVDAPSDHAELLSFRSSAAHAEDVRHVIAALRALAPAPVWLVGTSMGTLSAASAAARLGPAASGGPDGIVLTSPVTLGSRRSGESRRSVRLEDIRVPTLIVTHRDDTCRVSPPGRPPTSRGP